MEKYYISDHILGYGRFFAITTAEHIKESRDILAEAYVFGLDSQGIFKGRVVRYNYYDGDEKVVKIDLDYMLAQAMNEARHLIYDYQLTKYNETKDNDFLKSTIDLKECGKEAMITLKNVGYREDLEQVAKDTLNSELSRYLDAILSFKFSIRVYERGKPMG